jgi:hypothetical protein
MFEFVSIIFDESMIRHIQKCTQIEARRVLENEWSVSLRELEKFIGLLYARGIMGGKNLPVKTLWSNNWGSKRFSECMARDRFLEIKKFLRFDIKQQRSHRLMVDKFALTSELWSPFIENCQKCYNPGETLCVDEQLFPTKARCPFTQYISNKPDKFGIKFFLLADVKTKYLLNGFPYLGKDERRPSHVQLSEYVVMRLMEGLLDKGYNIVCDNFYTPLSFSSYFSSGAKHHSPRNNANE